MKRQYIGYHGTETRFGRAIVKTQSFRVSTGIDTWLGDGAYFFEDDPAEAKWWVTHKKRFPKWMIVRARIVSEDKYVFDVTIDANRQVIERLADRVAETLGGINKGIVGTRDEVSLDAAAINLYCMDVENDVKIVRGVFLKGRASRHLRITRVQSILAVRDVSCISDIICFEEGTGA